MYKFNIIKIAKTFIHAFFDGGLTGLIHPRFQTEKLPVIRISKREQILKNKNN
jgi:hypothetical protein